MPTIIALDNDHARVCIHTDTRIVHHEFKQFIFGEKLHEALTAGVELMEQHRATKWLSDDRKNGVVGSADQEWALKSWYPRVLRAGWKHWAVVLPETVVGQMNIRRFVEGCRKDGLETRVFVDPTEAMAWLCEV